MFTIQEVLDLALRIEKNGEEAYRKAMDKVSNPSLSSLFQWLADEETKHWKWFSEQKGKVDEPIEDSELEEMGRRILQGILGDQSFSLQDADFSKVEHFREAVSTAIEFEKDTILFYEMIRALVDEKESLEHLDTIIEEENRHVELLHQVLRDGVRPWDMKE